MKAVRTCYICGKPLTGMAPSARTCGATCRKKRQRARAKINDETRAQNEATVGRMVRNEHTDIVKRVLQTELAPIVRGAIDEEVLRAINAMVGLTPRAVQVLADQLDSPDPVLADRAAATVLKYTVGHPALVKPADNTPPPFTVQFQLPRPEGSQPEPVDAEPVEEGEEATRVCDICTTPKPIDQFEADSSRCSQCFLEYQQQLLHSFT